MNVSYYHYDVKFFFLFFGCVICYYWSISETLFILQLNVLGCLKVNIFYYWFVTDCFFFLQLNVQGCMKLTIDGIVDCLKSYKLVAVTGIKHLRVHAILGVTQKHFEELKSLLGIDDNLQNNHMPCFLLQGSPHLSNDDDRPIDIDMCPRCQNPRLVYDCPVRDCQGKDHTTQVCRACTLCIARCVQCGKCLNDEKYEETFFLEKVCSDCWNQALLCQVSEDVGNTTMHG